MSPNHSNITIAQITESASVFRGPSGVSATTYGRTEDVGIITIVVPEFELGHVQRQIFAADLVEAAHDAALQQRPEAVVVCVCTTPSTY